MLCYAGEDGDPWKVADVASALGVTTRTAVRLPGYATRLSHRAFKYRRSASECSDPAEHRSPEPCAVDYTRSADQKQPARLAGASFGRAVDARGNRTTGPIDRDAPEVSEAEGKRLRRRGGCVVQIVAVFFQVVAEVVVVFSAKKLEECGAGFGVVDAPLRFFVSQTLARRSIIGAEKGIGFGRGAVGVEGENIRGHRPRRLVARVTVDAIEHRIELVSPKQPQVGEENIDGDPARGADRQSLQPCFVERDDCFAVAEVVHDFAKIARQAALPAKRIYAAGKRSADEFMKTLHLLDASRTGRQGERGHARREKW